jgi:M6 family metalloprotease-like protein
MPIAGGHSSAHLGKNGIAVPPYDALRRLQSIPKIEKSVFGFQKMLVLLVDFPDYKWDTQQDTNFYNPVNMPGFEGLYQPEYYHDMLFSLQSFRDPFSQSGLTGSMRDYYRENSYGQFDLDGVVASWNTVSQPYRHYANNDGIPNTSDDHGFGGGANNVSAFIREAIELADPGLDFSEFDTDGDGFVDAFFVVHAGPGAEELFTTKPNDHFDYFWSHQSAVYYQTNDGVVVGRYTMEPQNGTIGVFCHEYGHVLGLPDLYDTGRSSEGIGEWGLMASGGWCFAPGDQLGTKPAHFSAWSKMKLGWLQPVDIRAGVRNMRLPPLAREAAAVKVWNDVMSTETIGPTEYFLLENRQNVLFDAGLTRRQVELGKPPANGLIIYHVNEAKSSNDNELDKLIDVEEASPIFVDSVWIENLDFPRDLSTYQYLTSGNRGDNGDPFPGYLAWSEDLTGYLGERLRNEFSDNTFPGSQASNGQDTHITIRNIRLEGEDVLFYLEADEQLSVSVEDQGSQVPGSFTLSIYPNPMTDMAQIVLAGNISDQHDAKIQVYNLLGQQVREISISANQTGQTTLIWDGRNQAGARVQSGIYFIVAKLGSIKLKQKILLTR